MADMYEKELAEREILQKSPHTQSNQRQAVTKAGLAKEIMNHKLVDKSDRK
jgi:hypothetical protein